MLSALYKLFHRDPLSTDPYLNPYMKKAIKEDTKPRRLSGLDLGQASDFAAFASVERREIADPEHPGKRLSFYSCDLLNQWPNGTPYTTIVSDMEKLFDREELAGTPLAVDYSGLGRPVIDFMRATRLKPILQPVSITGGMNTTDGYMGAKNVPKRTLAIGLTLLYNSKRIVVSPSLKWTKSLNKQIATLTHKIRSSGADSYEALKESDHDDLCCALALAVWLGEGGGKRRFNMMA